MNWAVIGGPLGQEGVDRVVGRQGRNGAPAERGEGAHGIGEATQAVQPRSVSGASGSAAGPRVARP